MDHTPFDRRELDRYAAQAKAKWGATDAYREYEDKTAGKDPRELEATGDGLMAIFAQLGALRQRSPADPEVQTMIGRLQSYITEHYYTCTKQILKGLGQLYTAGGSMTENIDRAGGEGTAEFAQRAIGIYCQ